VKKARWIGKVLRRIADFASARKVSFTLKALQEMAGLSVDEEDACEVLAELTAEDCLGRQRSKKTGEWMYAFKPEFQGVELYVKVVLRESCVLISFHEDEAEN
jgi:hypothetical protein